MLCPKCGRPVYDCDRCGRVFRRGEKILCVWFKWNPICNWRYHFCSRKCLEKYLMERIIEQEAVLDGLTRKS